MWLPDTNFWIDILKRPAGPTAARFQTCQAGDIATSFVVWAELLHGARKYGLPEERRDVIIRLLSPFICHPCDVAVAFRYAEIRDDLESRGEVIGPLDLLLAATALVHDLIVVTRNTTEFGRVNGLRIQDWSLPIPVEAPPEQSNPARPQ